MHEQSTEISNKIAQNNVNHGIGVDDRNRLNTFNVGDIVQKLHACSSDPFQILMKLNDNIHGIYLYIHFGINSTFNIDCLMDYKGLDVIQLVDEPSTEPIFESLFLSPLLDILPYTAYQVDKFLDKIITTQDSGIRKYLICWIEKYQLMIHG